REAYEAAQQAAADRQDKEIARVQKFVDRFRYQATKARQVQSRLKQLEKIKRVERTRDPKRVRFRFPVPSSSGRHVLELQGVALARMLVKPTNTLFLDEPTNHLDPASVDVLTDALVEFPGTMVFISHDPVFLTRVATRVVEIEAGQARDYHGDYEYYLWKKVQELEPLKGTPEFDSKPSTAPSVSKAAPTTAPRSRTSETSAFKAHRELTKT